MHPEGKRAEALDTNRVAIRKRLTVTGWQSLNIVPNPLKFLGLGAIDPDHTVDFSSDSGGRTALDRAHTQ